jgi:AraC family transcriptional regulator, regulatory protein of adaptative response / methylated-DNA-[protein]-cysteine methyltransferase
MQDYESEFWQAVLSHDASYDGRFVYAVQSTGIYCRPSCPSRRPGRENVHFFALPAEAEAAGYRPCRRCQPDRPAREEPNLALVQQICAYLAEPHEHLPTLADLARRYNLSPYHLQRTFKRLIGVSPRQYADQQRLQRLKAGLQAGQAATDALYGAGYQSSSSVYDHARERLGMTPGEYRRQGQGLSIAYVTIPCPLGWLLVAATSKGICAVKLGDTPQELQALLLAEFPAATVSAQDDPLHGWVGALVAYVGGEVASLDLPLDVRATAFQRRVWDALLRIPYGATRSYKEVAGEIGQPSAVRAVAHACATNPVALIVPCHRVVRTNGDLAGFRWGLARKAALLENEKRNTGQRG